MMPTREPTYNQRTIEHDGVCEVHQSHMIWSTLTRGQLTWKVPMDKVNEVLHHPRRHETRGRFMSANLNIAGCFGLHMEFWPGGHPAAHEGFSTIAVRARRIGDIEAKCTLDLEGCNMMRTWIVSRDKMEKSWFFTNWVQIHKFPECVQQDNTLQIIFCIDVYEVRPEFDLPATDNSIIGRLFDTGIQSDVDIYTPTTQCFSCHKCILACHSPVFEKMFQHEMEESLNNVVEIDDIDPATVEIFLRYLYTFKLSSNLTPQTLESVMLCADKYAVEPLVVEALGKLIGNVNIDTAAAAYVKAVQYTNVLQARGFKQKLIDFIGRNLNEVCNTPGWLRAKKIHPTICEDLVAFLATREAQVSATSEFPVLTSKRDRT